MTLGIGAIIGTGIFVLTGTAAAQVLESVKGPSRDEDEVSGLGVIGRIAEEDLQTAVDDIK